MPVSLDPQYVIELSKSNRQRPMISVDKWIWDSINYRSQRSQHIEVSESNIDEVKLPGAALIVSLRVGEGF